jgi:hypothetical protein
MPGARCTRSLICKKVKAYERRHREVHRFHPAFPHAMVLTVSSVIFPVIGFVVTVISRMKFRQLDASIEASEPHDFAVRIACCSSAAHPRPSHPVPRFVTIASAPWWDETARVMDLIWQKREGVYFCNRDWTEKSTICPAGRSALGLPLVRHSGARPRSANPPLQQSVVRDELAPGVLFRRLRCRDFKSAALASTEMLLRRDLPRHRRRIGEVTRQLRVARFRVHN